MKKMAPLVVRGIDITSTETLPGCVLVLGSSGIITREMASEIAELFSLSPRYAATAVPQETFDRDVAFHATTQSSPYSIARVPILLAPTVATLQKSQRFVVTASEFDPKIHTGVAAKPTVDLHQVVGINVYGLEIRAHNADGVKAACAWCASEEGRSEIAKVDFVEHVVKSSSEAHYRKDVTASAEDSHCLVPFKRGDVVVFVSEECTGEEGGEKEESLVVVRVNVVDTAVQVVDGKQKKRWVRWDQVKLSTAQT